MEPTSSAAVVWLTGQIADKAVGWGTKTLLESLQPKVDKVREGIARLEEHALEASEKSDDRLVAPMREGILRWKLGELDRAIEKLHEAHGQNPVAPVVSLALAHALITRGGAAEERQVSVIAELIASAARLNPYAFEFWFGGNMLPRLRNLVDAASTPPGGDWKPWCCELGDDDVVKDAAKRFSWPAVPLWDRARAQVDPLDQPRSTAAIARASLCGSHLAVEWLLTSTFTRPAERAVGLFALESGRLRWARLNKGDELVFLTYSHVVVRNDHHFLLLNVATGDPESRFNRRYFESMFGDPSPVSPAFQSANWLGTSPDDAYEKSAEFFHRPVPKGSPEFHRPRPFSEGARLHDPGGFHGRTVAVENVWYHDHFTPPGFSYIPYCKLYGNGTVALV